MTFVIKTGVVLLLVCFVSAQQRVAPGVPPQQYQQQHGQMHPAPPQYQQQYQQVPVQPQYQQAGYQQQPPQGGYHEQPQQAYQQQPQQHQQQLHQPQQQQQQAHHGHHGHQAGQPVLNTGNIKEERAHIAEHMDVPIDTSKMTEQELQFHYFKMHDSDNNNKLDGCELIKSLIHWHEEGSKAQGQAKSTVPEKIFSDEELVALIDPILQTDDTSRDGFIDYPEFIQAQHKAAQNRPPQQ